jgi:hypothetical protein
LDGSSPEGKPSSLDAKTAANRIGLYRLGAVFAIASAAGAFIFATSQVSLVILLAALALAVIDQCAAEMFRTYWQTAYRISSYGKAVKVALIVIYTTFLLESLLLIVDGSLANSFLIMVYIMLEFAEFILLFIVLVARTFQLSRIKQSRSLVSAQTTTTRATPPLLTVYRGKGASFVFAGITATFTSLGYWLVSSILLSSLEIFAIVFVLMFLILYFSFRTVSPKVEFYDDHFRIVQAGTVRVATLYSDIGSLELHLRPLVSQIVIHGKHHNDKKEEEEEKNDILAIVPSNPRKHVLGGNRLFDWLEFKSQNRVNK